MERVLPLGGAAGGQHQRACTAEGRTGTEDALETRNFLLRLTEARERRVATKVAAA